MELKDVVPGEKYKIRSWRDMEKEFGLDPNSDIDNPWPTFVRSMAPFCGTVVTAIPVIRGSVVAQIPDPRMPSLLWSVAPSALEAM